jgi:tetratricopeptide (TPR) repeat protein
MGEGVKVDEAGQLLGFAEDAGGQLGGLEAKSAARRLEGRYRELAEALSWFLAHGRAEEALRMALALTDFWQATSRIAQGREFFGQALGMAGVGDGLRAEALFQAGLLAFWQGDDEAARRLHQQSLDLSRRLGDPTGTALALTGLARIALRSDLDRAQVLSQQALDAVAGCDEQRGRSNALHLLGVTAQMKGNLEEARGWMTQRLELARQMGAYRAAAGEAGNLSVVERQLGNLPRAQELACEGLALAARRGDDWMIPYGLNDLAAIAVAHGEHARAATLLGAAERLMAEQGTAWPPDEAPHFERSKAAVVHALTPADLQQAWSQGRSMPGTDAIALALGSAQAR